MTTTARAIVIELPLPPRALSSNARVHWSRRHRETKGYRESALMHMRVSLQNERHAPKPPVRVSYAFCTKNARRIGLYAPRDHTNAVDAIKAAQDGIADALGFDDSAKYMRLGTVTIDATVGPFVRVVVEPCEGGQG